MSLDHPVVDRESWPATALRGARLGRLPAGDMLLAAGLTAVTCLSAALSAPAGRLAIPLTLGALITAPLAVRRLAPIPAAVLGLTAATVYGLLGYGPPPDAGLGMAVGMFTVASMCRWPVAVLTFLASAGTVLAAYRLDPVDTAVPRLGQAALLLIIGWVLGAGPGRRPARTGQLSAEAVRAVAADRVRIAREMHDVVAHHLSVISLQAGVAEYVLDEDPAGARAAVATVAASSREALRDMRRLLDVLREEDDPASGVPTGPDGLAELVDRTRRAGLAVELTMTGEFGTVPEGLRLCAYRVVQESLTNVLKHAGPATARVAVVIDDRMLTVTVEDDGGPSTPARETPATGHGIRGMRERAETYGGVLTAGPCGTGFTVRLTAPLDAAAGVVR